jgi:dTDP-4-dehydrorhamnose 3,5-epimerase
MEELGFNKIKLTNLKQFYDSRGAVLHMLRNDDEEFVSFGECYFSEVLPGVIKGWKRHKIQTQNITVPVGKIKFVFYEISQYKSSNNIYELVLGRPDNYVRLKIPPGIWYSFSCISEQNALIANCVDIPHDPNETETMNLNNDIIPYNWSK